MMTKIDLDNLKCGGCASSIRQGLHSFPEILDVTVDLEAQSVEIGHKDHFPLERVKEKLRVMGYPERGTLEGFDKFKANAKSYVSCAIGKISTNEQDEKF